MKRRVVVTGMGVVAPVGNNVADFWNNIKNGKSGIDFITRFDTADFKVKIAAEVKNLNIEDYMPKKETKRMDIFCQYAIAAADQAMADSGLNTEAVDPHRFGVIVGSGIGGLSTIEEQVIRMHNMGPARIGPLFVPMAIVNMASGNIAIRFGAKGFSGCSVTACASANNSIGDAYRKIQDGIADIMLAGGAEASICGIGIGGFANLKALTESTDPSRASIPFDLERKGFVMGEGAGILVLEELEMAQKRGAKVYAEIVGYGTNCDAHHMTSPDPEGEGATGAIELALSDQQIPKHKISYINAHGTSTKLNDAAETMAIKRVFGEGAYKIPVSSTKSMIGHLLGAAGAAEAIITIMALRENFLPPTIGYQQPDEECDLDYVPNKGRSHPMAYALSNSFGFGGHNAVLCFKKWEGNA